MYIQVVDTISRHIVFQKQNPSPIDEVRSDTSGETTASDSGRGCSEDDIQLVQMPRVKGNVVTATK